MSPRILAAALAAAVFFAPFLAASAQEDQAPPATLDELDARLAQAIKDAGVPGASVAIIENGQVVLVKGYGFSDVAAQKPVTPDTVFRAGSISKSLTSIAIMQMVEQGKLSLDGKLADLAPEIKFVNPWEATDPVRLVHLLEHTSGWPDITFDILLQDGTGWTLRQGVDYSTPVHVSRWKPGLYSTYSNEGPAVAGYILEQASGEGFSAYTRGHVLRPMGMVSADFDLTPELQAHLSKSYGPDGVETPYQTIILPPSGSLATNVRDMAQLVLFYLGRGTVNGQQILAPASVDRIEHQLTTLAARYGLDNGYGLGNAPFPAGTHTYRGHNGGIDSFVSVYGYSVRNNSGFVVLSNSAGGANFGDPILALIDSYLMRGIVTPPPAPYAVDAKELEASAGFYATVSPRNDFLNIYFETVLMAANWVTFEDGKLFLQGHERVPVGPHVFQRDDRYQPSLAFFEHEGERYLATAYSTARQESMAGIAPKAIVLVLLILSLAIGILLLPFQLYGWFKGRLKERGGMLVRALPLLGLLALVATFALPFFAFLSEDVNSTMWLAKPGPFSYTILAASIAFPVLAALGLWRAWKAENLPAFVRGHVFVANTTLLTAAAYAATFGWLGVQTWTW